MIKRKIWHLSDFQETAKFMYIVLDKDFHDRFYNTAIEVAGSQRRLAKRLGFYSSRINNYLHHVRRPSLERFIKISNFLVNNGKSEFGMIEVEKHVTKIKVNGQPISISPKFPVLMNKDLVKIVASILGDGGINKFFDPFYSNGDPILLSNFKVYMKNVFGCDASREHGSGKRIQIWYPRIVGKMLIDMFGPFSFGKNPKYTPEIILDAEKYLKGEFLNSFYGDEGSSPPYQVTVYQGFKNVKLLYQVKEILKEFNIKTNDVIKIKGNHIMIDPRTGKKYEAKEMFLLSISKYKEIIKFIDNIGFPYKSVKFRKLLQMLKNNYKKFRYEDLSFIKID